MAKFSKNKLVLAGSIVLVLAIVAVIALSIPPRVPSGIASVTPGTNVLAVSLAMTHGTNHLHYYPSRVNFELNALYQRFMKPKANLTQRLRRHTYAAADTIWVTATHSGPLPEPKNFRAEIVTAEGRKRLQTATGGVYDTNRSTTVTCWSLHGGIQDHRGSTMKIVDTATGSVLATIQLE